MKRATLIAAIAVATQLHAQDITEYRYWLNDDVSTLATAAVPASPEALVNTTLDLPALTKEYNIITFQFKDSNGEYSVPQSTWFTKSTGAVTGYTYWIDDDIANSTQGTIGPDMVVDLVADMPTSITNGTHLFTIRFSSANGTWSVPLTTEFSFLTSVDDLAGVHDLLLFPNPLTDELSLRVNAGTAGSLNLTVLDLSGAVVRELSTWSVSGSMQRSWDMSALAAGAYVLRIGSDQGTHELRFVKQ